MQNARHSGRKRSAKHAMPCRTTLVLRHACRFDPAQDPPALLQAGDTVKFVPMSEDELAVSDS